MFENAKTFGSLIQVPPKLAAKLPEIEQRLDDVLQVWRSDARLWLMSSSRCFSRLGCWQRQYDAVVANPPYMGMKWLNSALKDFVKDAYPDSKPDLCTCFIERCATFSKQTGIFSLVTMHGWMFL